MTKTKKFQIPPNSRRKFSGKWDELAYLCDKLMYYLHFRREKYKGKRFITRLRNLLVSVKHSGDAIIGETASALIYEYDGKWNLAVVHREREIDLILKLYNSFTADQSNEIRNFALEKYQQKDVLSRFRSLKKTYETNADKDSVRTISKLIDRVRSSGEF